VALVEPEEAEVDEGKNNSVYLQASCEKGAHELQRRINWSIGPATSMTELRPVYFRRGPGEKAHHLLFQVLAAVLDVCSVRNVLFCSLTFPHGVGTFLAVSPSPDPYLDSQKGQVHHSSDFIESNDLHVGVSRYSGGVGDSASHRSLVSDNRRLFMASGDYERLKGQAGANDVSNTPMDVERVPDSVNGQGNNYDGSSGSNSDSPDGNGETEHRVRPDIRRTPATGTGALENKVPYSC
jgi:hypothetical protein